MNLRKENWGKVQLGEVCSKVQKVNNRQQSGLFNYIDIGSVDSSLKRVKGVKQVNWDEASSRARQIVKRGDTLFSTVRVNLERIAYLDNEIERGIASTGFTVIRPNEKILSEFLFYSSITPRFIEKISQLQKGTAYPAVTDKIVFNEKIYLPSIDEQKQIASLFQTMETAIEQIDGQEKNLISLQSSLISGLLEQYPHFGTVLNKKNTKLTKLGDIADCIEEHDKAKKKISRFVGLENIDPENYQIENWGNISDGTTFTKLFNSGDILFGKRRPYLKKVAVAHFDGICSGDVLVFRAKKEAILPELLPFYVASEAFINHAVKTSAGSLSPRTKWKDLREFEFVIPDLEAQDKILEILNQIQTLLKYLKEQKMTLNNLKQNLLNEILG